MNLLEFAIPTWKRPHQLRNSVCSIAEQGCPVVISHHLCDTETLPVVEELKKKYPTTVRSVACELGIAPDYSDSFKQVFGLSEAKYTWTFGDDDILIPDAVKVITPILERDEFDFIHVSEVIRCHNSGRLVKAKLLDLCCNLGWLDMTGFISCNIVKTEKLNEAMQLNSWPLYAKNAFVQSCALFEVLHDKNCAYFDNALVDSKTQLDEVETGIRWGAGNVGMRYHYVDDALMDMRSRGIIGTVTPKFFRYLSYHLWDRFLNNIASAYNSTENYVVTDYIDGLLKRCLNLTTFLDKMNEKRYADEIMEVKRAMIAHAGALKYAIKIAEDMDHIIDNHNKEHYETEYLPERLHKVSPRE